MTATPATYRADVVLASDIGEPLRFVVETNVAGLEVEADTAADALSTARIQGKAALAAAGEGAKPLHVGMAPMTAAQRLILTHGTLAAALPLQRDGFDYWLAKAAQPVWGHGLAMGNHRHYDRAWQDWKAGVTRLQSDLQGMVSDPKVDAADCPFIPLVDFKAQAGPDNSEERGAQIDADAATAAPHEANLCGDDDASPCRNRRDVHRLNHAWGVRALTGMADTLQALATAREGL